MLSRIEAEIQTHKKNKKIKQAAGDVLAGAQPDRSRDQNINK
jgi:hypothetical protein